MGLTIKKQQIDFKSFTFVKQDLQKAQLWKNTKITRPSESIP